MISQSVSSVHQTAAISQSASQLVSQSVSQSVKDLYLISILIRPLKFVSLYQIS